MPRATKYMALASKLEKHMALMEENTFLPPEQQLADKFGVSKPTLRRALQEMVDLGRLRKINGVGVMLTKPPRTISRELIFLCHDINFFAESINSFGIRALKLNYFVSIVPLGGDAQTQERIVLSTVERCPAGVVVYADPKHNNLAAFHQLGASGIPGVYLMRLPRGIDSSLLEFGNFDGITEIVENFYQEGCRKIALYGNETVNQAAAVEREAGFIAGMKKCRLKVRPEFYCGYGSSKKHQESFLCLFENAELSPDAVCCLNDYCAGQLIKELIQRKINVDDIRFSGFDHSALSDFIPHALLTVDPPMKELGKTAAEMLIKQVENPHFGFQRKKLQAKVIRTK